MCSRNYHLSSGWSSAGSEMIRTQHVLLKRLPGARARHQRLATEKTDRFFHRRTSLQFRLIVSPPQPAREAYQILRSLDMALSRFSIPRPGTFGTLSRRRSMTVVRRYIPRFASGI
jgi:hypothetical protein